MQSIALESYYILDEDAIATESAGNLINMVIGFLVQIVKKLGQLLLAHWPRLLAVLASFVIPVAIARASGVNMNGIVNEISTKMVSIGDHVIGVIQDFATGLRDLTGANIHLQKMIEDNREMVTLNDKIVKHLNTHAGVVGQAFITKDVYKKCQEAYNRTKEIITEANERLQKAKEYDWEGKGANSSIANDVRRYFSDVQDAFTLELKNINVVMTNITTGLARYRK